MTDEQPPFRIESIRPAASDVEVAAITATLGLLATRRHACVHPEPERLSVWVDASRRSAQRAGLQRGPWRLSGRIARRSRA